MASCSITKTIPEGQYLLTKYSVEVDNKDIDKEDLYGYVKQKPNRKILFTYRFHLRMYNIGDNLKDHSEKKKIKSEKRIAKRKKKGKRIDMNKEMRRRDKSIKNWLQNTVGEPPVILDTLLSENSAKQLRMYLFSIGHFNAEVIANTEYKEKKKAEVNYVITSGEAYTINEITYSIKDPMLKAFIYANKSNSLLQKGENFNVDNIEDERLRITNILKNTGYYDFSKEYIIFNIDTTKAKLKTDINIIIRQAQKEHPEFKDSLVYSNHKRYKVENIYIYTDYQAIVSDTSKHDTTKIIVNNSNRDKPPSVYYFLHQEEKLRINPKTITQSVYIISNQHFKLEEIAQTQRSLAELGIYKYINIKFEQVKVMQNEEQSRTGRLNCFIHLSRTPIQSFSVETEGTNTGGDLGVAANLIYSNKNVFRGAEILNLKLHSAMEIQKTGSVETEEDPLFPKLPFNSFEAGFQVSLEIPRFLIPFKPERFPKYFKPKTHLKTALLFEQRPDYTRFIGNASFGYKWKPSTQTQHIFNPIEINLVRIFPDSLFSEKIENLSPGLRSSYKDHLIVGMSYSFIATNKKSNKQRNVSYFRGNIEAAGNLLRSGNKLFNSAQMGQTYQILGITYSQFVKTDFDYRFYHNIINEQQIAFRVSLGFGLPYGNSEFLPFEEAFSLGGANSIRAWQFRSLGPGNYNDDGINSFDKTGDMKFESSVEYRFPIFSFVEGALFFDMGNIWYLNDNEQFEGGEFKTKNFIGEMAMGTGFGTRLNFGFFIIRLDGGIRIKDPSKAIGERYVFTQNQFKDINWNIGIGYPF
jgi:outer membrane protein assembly factor BamA